MIKNSYHYKNKIKEELANMSEIIDDMYYNLATEIRSEIFKKQEKKKLFTKKLMKCLKG